MAKIAVIGAGIGGMSAAYDLNNAGHSVTVFESTNRVGGLAGGFKEPSWDWSVEEYYHHWFASDQHILGLINELGWRDQVVFRRPYTVLYHAGEFYPFDSIPQAILFRGLGWGFRKIRFGFVGLFLKLTNDWKTLEKYTVAEWMRRWAGDAVYEMMWQPLMIGKFGEKYADQVNMAWMWARLKSRTTRLGTFQGGFQAFSNKLAAHLLQSGVEIRMQASIRRISPISGASGVVLETEQGLEQFDLCLVTTSPSAMARLAPDLPASYLKGLLNLKSMGAVVMVLALKHQLSEKGYYWYNLPKTAGYPFLALVEHTNFLSPEYFGGEHIIYIGDYLEPEHEYFSMTQAELLERFLPSLSRINPHFKTDWVRKTWLSRTAYAQPVPLLNHSRNVPQIETPIPGLYFASMSQVYPWDRGTNYAVEICRRAARIMISSQNQIG
jgi:protoporphyrinogen oxidase